MSMDANLVSALNAQIRGEFAASYVYLGMSAYFESLDLKGFAGWMRAQSQEEWAHGMRIFDHLAARDAPISLAELSSPTTDYYDPKSAVAAALAQEQDTTRDVNQLYAQAISCGDYQAKGLLDWFVNEQTEEEDSLRTLLSQLTIAGDSGAALLILDRELSERDASDDEPMG